MIEGSLKIILKKITVFTNLGLVKIILDLF